MYLVRALAMIIQKCHPRTVFKILLLTLGACSIFIFKRMVILDAPITDNQRLGPAFTLINSAENSHLEYLHEFADTSDAEKINLMKKIRDSVKTLHKRCAEVNTRCNTYGSQQNILTLFTTWIYEREKFPINNRTLFNWKALPNVNLVVFTNSTEVKYHSERAGFKTLPITKEASGAPVLPTMYVTVMNNFNSEFYAFANGDILFTRSLIDTLKHIQCHLDSRKRENGLLIVGRRVNVPASMVTDEVVMSWDKLDHIASKGALFQSDAEDYFITDKSYPWHNFLPVVIGRRAYDNWVVAFSRYHNITVIDASESIQCLHQTLESRGNFEGLEKGSYNRELVDQLGMPFSLYSWGRTLCTSLKSWVNLCGQIVISERLQIDKECTSFDFIHSIYKLLGFRS